MKEWQPIETAPKEILSYAERDFVDLWMHICASPRSFGMADAFRVTDCWREDGKWFHRYLGEPAELYNDYITHWMPKPPPPGDESATSIPAPENSTPRTQEGK